MSNDKAANQLFRELMDRSRLHIRVGGGKHDATEVRLIGTAYELHGPNGCCTCCAREGNSPAKQGETWDNRDEPDRGVSAPQPGSDRPTRITEQRG